MQVRLWLNQIPVPSIHFHSDSNILFLSALYSAYFLVIYSTFVLPSLKLISPNYFEVIVIYIAQNITFFLFLTPIISCLRQVPVFAWTSMLPSVIRCHTSRFLRAIVRCESLHPLSFTGGTYLNLKVSQRRPIDRIIYYFIAFGQLLLFIVWSVWIFLFICFVNATAKRVDLGITFYIVYIPVVTSWVYGYGCITGRLGEIKWWPSRDRLSHFVPPSIQNSTITRCGCILLFYQSFLL